MSFFKSLLNAGGKALGVDLGGLVGGGTTNYQPGMPDDTPFGAADYLQRYPDVANNWQAPAYQHYLDFGRKEGRTWNAQPSPPVPPPIPTYAGNGVIVNPLSLGDAGIKLPSTLTTLPSNFMPVGYGLPPVTQPTPTNKNIVMYVIVGIVGVIGICVAVVMGTSKRRR